MSTVENDKQYEEASNQESVLDLKLEIGYNQ